MTSNFTGYAHLKDLVYDLAEDPQVPDSVVARLDSIKVAMSSDSVTLGQDDMANIIVALGTLADPAAPRH
jgi:hypothetical protein